jgi:hypothetical protein
VTTLPGGHRHMLIDPVTVAEHIAAWSAADTKKPASPW